ncbi:MAG TPA: hypothetical protein VGQ73_02380 [Gemmatimonadales bacterium]|jgi:hypothetical protein|nr:hypothetical protein [Gemmatimonadales bacterium]
MRTSTLVVLGGAGLIGYLIYRSLKSTVQSAAPKLQSNIPAGLIAQIQANQYPGQELRMGINTPTTGLTGYGR